MSKSDLKALFDLHAKLKAFDLNNQEIRRIQHSIDWLQQFQPATNKNFVNSLMFAPQFESSMTKMIRELNQHNEQTLKAFSNLHDTFASFQNQIDQYNSLFLNPSVDKIHKAFTEHHSDIQRLVEHYKFNEDKLKRFSEQMNAKWMQIEDERTSVLGLGKLYGIGSILTNGNPFSEDVSSILRQDLGDWRDVITSPHAGSTIHDLYQDIGFDHQLTDFPTPAFERGVKVAKIRIIKPQELSEYIHCLSLPPDDWKSDGDRYRDEAYQWLAALETHLRRFIHQEMSKSFGSNWPRHQLPNGIYENWLEKQNRTTDEDKPELTLINFADFTDYERIILRRDNWGKVFSQFFQREESVRESFNRMQPIRLDICHFRPVSHEAYLTFHIECNRLIKVINR